MVNSVLISFNESLFPLNHWTKCFNSVLMIDSVVRSFLRGNIRLESPAEWYRIDFENRHCRSLMYKRTKKRPRVDP